MISRISKVLIFVAVTGLVASCKLAVILVEGGEVQSIGSGTCITSPTVPQTGTVCIHEVADTTYSETFTAVPDTGWEFVKWNTGGGFLCPDSTDPTCVVSNVLLAGNSVAEAIVASDAAYYIMPIFAESGLPITDTVTANGKEWAQVELFYNLSWDEIDAVCASNPCVEGSVLNGYNMTGWTWASNSDFVDLLNSYGINPPLVTPANGGSIAYTTAPQGWGVQFFAAWNAITDNGICEQVLEGWLSDTYLTSKYAGGVGKQCPFSAEFLDTVQLAPIEFSPTGGAWFYRPLP
jgi:hypothetical protein